MSFLKKIFIKSPEDLEKKGDKYLEEKNFGLAKLEYEKSIDKLKKNSPENKAYLEKLTLKYHKAINELATRHLENAIDLIESNIFDEASELLNLALELSTDKTLTDKIVRQREILGKHDKSIRKNAVKKTIQHTEVFESDNDEDFYALCASLPEDIAGAYYEYGEKFKEGYLALGDGDFENASSLLSEALEENPAPDSYIRLELSTALLNSGKPEKALEVLNQYHDARPDSYSACHLMCEIFWALGDFKSAHNLLERYLNENEIPLEILLLKSETFYFEEKFTEAADICQVYIDNTGWDDQAAYQIAKAKDASGEYSESKSLYSEIIGNCTSCGRMPDQNIVRRFAIASFETGDHSEQILNIFLDLAQNDPENRKDYFTKVSKIYESRGNKGESKRFFDFAQQES